MPITETTEYVTIVMMLVLNVPELEATYVNHVTMDGTSKEVNVLPNAPTDITETTIQTNVTFVIALVTPVTEAVPKIV
jgi:hypothetical protein